MKKLPYYQVEGNYREIGEFLGTTFGEQIREAIERRKKDIVGYGEYLPKSAKCLAATRECFGGLVEETEAIAKAAGVDVVDYFFMNNREVYDEAEEWDVGQAVNPDHCTVVAGCDGERLVVGHNEDWAKEAQDQVYILKAKVGETTFLGINYMGGIPGLAAAMNSWGLVQCINDLYQVNGRVGVPKNYLARAVLEARNLDEAEELIRKTPKASGFNHVLVQGREVRNIEIAGDEVEVERVVGRPYVHTNHYLTEKLQKLEKFHTKSSEARYVRASELLTERMREEEVKKILSDTKNLEYPICRREETIAAAVFVPGEKKAEFCYGHSCQGVFDTFRLE